MSAVFIPKKPVTKDLRNRGGMVSVPRRNENKREQADKQERARERERREVGGLKQLGVESTHKGRNNSVTNVKTRIASL